MKLVKNDTVLFLGDSITDCDRDRQDPHDLGHGFARLVADQLAETFPTAGFTFYNRGIGGNKAADVLARLQEDCLQLTPDVLVFMIGINDTWHNAG
ncbi:SGNH/GDSL hydrolase family protein, partial [Enterococcus casseliflavus]